MWQTIIHVVFSAIGIAYVERISNGPIEARHSHAHGQNGYGAGH